MSHDDDEVEIDEITLWEAGGVTIPHAANQFARAANHLHATSAFEASAFGPGLGASMFQTIWTELRDVIQDEVLVATHGNLTAAGEALCVIAQNFAAEDEATADKLIAAIEDSKNDSEPSNRPPDQDVIPNDSDDDPPLFV